MLFRNILLKMLMPINSKLFFQNEIHRKTIIAVIGYKLCSVELVYKATIQR